MSKLEYGIAESIARSGFAPEEIDRMPAEEKAELFDVLRKDIQLHSENPWKYYVPCPVGGGMQERFDVSLATIRVMKSMNKVGKTAPLAVEAWRYAHGVHPHRTIEVPCRQWIVSSSYGSASEDILEELWKWAPKAARDWFTKAPVPTFEVPVFDANSRHIGYSTIILKSAEAGERKFEGAKLRHIIINEQPDDIGVWKECLSREDARIPLDISMGYTPLYGVNWFEKDVINRIIAGGFPSAEVFSAKDLSENIYLTAEQIERFKQTWKGDPQEKARVFGIASPKEGLVYAYYRHDLHDLTSYQWSEDQPVFVCIDVHPHLPMQAAFLTVDQHEEWFVCDEVVGLDTKDKLQGAKEFASQFCDVAEKYVPKKYVNQFGSRHAAAQAGYNQIAFILCDNNAKINERTSTSNILRDMNEVLRARLKRSALVVGKKDFQSSWERINTKMKPQIGKDGKEYTEFHFAPHVTVTKSEFENGAWDDPTTHVDENTEGGTKPKKGHDHMRNALEYIVSRNIKYNWRVPQLCGAIQEYEVNSSVTGY